MAAPRLAHERVACGLATDMCVQLTAGDALLREYPRRRIRSARVLLYDGCEEHEGP